MTALRQSIFWLIGALGLALAGMPALAASPVQEVQAHGVSAWLQSDPAVPVVAIAFQIEGGAATDPPTLQGRASLLVDLLTEGAGEMDDRAFKERLANLSATISIQATQDGISGMLYTLSKNLPEAADMLGLALSAPRFDPAALERAQASHIASLISAR